MLYFAFTASYTGQILSFTIPLNRADATPHQFLIAASDVRLLIGLFVSGPAVGNEVADNRRVIDDLRTGPPHHKCRLIHVLDVHVDGSAAARCIKQRG